ncbi:MAG: 16S rRNA (uracil(1498)-N(3))-methyltransferase [Clostridia bacterium]|nr:16S rRNA (uracil(1498)-N(3))-methyltransferase [Clostridia bacterium]
MKRFFVDKSSFKGDKIVIEGIEHNHIKNVMRLNVGDSIVVVCGDEYDYYATITDMKKGETVVVITDKRENPYNPVHNVTVFQALTKTDNMQLIVQKLTELGVTTFYPVITEFITSKDKMGKSDKLQVVSNQSIKQCKRSVPMLIENVIKFKDMVDMLSDYDIVFFANETEKQVSLQDKLAGVKGKVAIIVGSEGGFSESEIDALKLPNVHSVSLGKRILRAETASIALTSVIMYAIGEWNV